MRLEGYQVVSESRARPDDPVRLTIAATTDIALCPHCARLTNTIHRRLDSDPIHDLPHGPQAVVLILRANQFHGEVCDRYFTLPCPHIAPGAHATERFLEQAAKLIRFADIANAAHFLGVPEKTLARWYDDYVEHLKHALDTNWKPITSLGIDELSLKKTSAIRRRVD